MVHTSASPHIDQQELGAKKTRFRRLLYRQSYNTLSIDLLRGAVQGQSRAVCQYLCRVVRASDATATATQDRSLIAGNDAWITGPRLAPSAVPATVLSFPLRYTQPRVECPSFILRSAASRSFALCSSFPATAARPPARC